MLVWTDLEATSLDTSKAAVLEVAVILTDDHLQEVGRFHRVLHWCGARWLTHLGPDSPEEAFSRCATVTGLDPVVIKMHAQNGLWRASWDTPNDVDVADAQLSEFLREIGGTDDVSGRQIAGSSVHFDRALMVSHLPRTSRELHYRSVDVTTLNELARRGWPRLYEERPVRRELHRAMPDIEDSLALCRYYVERIGGLLPKDGV